jgi:hypothetical protein
MRLRQSSSRNASNAKNASRSVRIGCICAPVKRAARHCAAIARQTITRANTRTRAGTPSSPLPSWVSAGCTVIRMMRSRSIKLWRFVYRSCRLKRFHKCCSHRPVAGPPRRCSFTLGRRPTGPWLQRLFTPNCERRMPAWVPIFSTYVCCSINFRICGAGIAPA